MGTVPDDVFPAVEEGAGQAVASTRERQRITETACMLISCCVSSWPGSLINTYILRLSLSLCSTVWGRASHLTLTLRTHLRIKITCLLFLVIRIAKLLYMISNHSIALCSHYIATLRIIYCFKLHFVPKYFNKSSIKVRNWKE